MLLRVQVHEQFVEIAQILVASPAPVIAVVEVGELKTSLALLVDRAALIVAGVAVMTIRTIRTIPSFRTILMAEKG